MKKMNIAKRIACLVLAVMMAVPVASVANLPAASTVEAAKAKKVTLYVGEEFDLGFARSLAKVKSSKQKVCKVGKYTSYGNKHYYLKAKKAGKATVSYKKYGQSIKYDITVKKASFATKFYNKGNGNFILEITNKTKQTFENVDVKYTIRDSSGVVLASDSFEVSVVQAKSKAYKEFWVSGLRGVTGLTCTAKVTPRFHQFTQKYTNTSKQLKITRKVVDASGYVNYTYKNTAKQNVKGFVYVLFYDGSGRLVDIGVPHSVSLKKNQTESYKATSYEDWATYKIITNTYYSK